MYLTQAVKRAAQVNPRGLATTFADRRRTWPEFGDRVARLAAGLKGLGLETGDRVAILALNSDRYLEFFFAVPWAGGVFVPINTRLAPPEIAHWLIDSETSVLFVDDHFLDALPAIKDEIGCVRRFVYMGDGAAPAGMAAYEALIQQSEPAADALRGYDELAGLFYTSGTTGRSKGVMLSHRNLVYNAQNVIPALGFGPDTVWLHAGPMFHLADGTATFAVAMVAGSHCFIPKFDPVDSLAAIAEHRATDSLFVPTMINMLVNHPRLTEFDISSLRGILYGASPMPEALIRKAMEVMPHVGFTQAYGQTECAPVLTTLSPEYHTLEGPRAGRLTSCGQAVNGVEVAILDEDDQEVPRGTVGQICGRGANVMQGYWRQPELTAEALRGGWLHTGDGGRMDEDGFVYVVDRLKDMIISGGENVYSAEVEGAVYLHPAVAECAVIGVPDDTWGERVHAIVRLKPGEQLDERMLIEHCKRQIANYKCPRSVEFRDQPLPLSGAGKILKGELRKPYWKGHSRNVN